MSAPFVTRKQAIASHATETSEVEASSSYIWQANKNSPNTDTEKADFSWPLKAQVVRSFFSLSN